MFKGSSWLKSHDKSVDVLSDTRIPLHCGHCRSGRASAVAHSDEAGLPGPEHRTTATDQFFTRERRCSERRHCGSACCPMRQRTSRAQFPGRIALVYGRRHGGDDVGTQWRSRALHRWWQLDADLHRWIGNDLVQRSLHGINAHARENVAIDICRSPLRQCVERVTAVEHRRHARCVQLVDVSGVR